MSIFLSTPRRKRIAEGVANQGEKIDNITFIYIISLLIIRPEEGWNAGVQTVSGWI